ncbi:hypothetical protein [Hyphomonas chukchiensis]|uniref:hypothetical protein n=1 Tax=Hyphomonas chukchiensis TaxID=1280947 RepID=UPI0030FD12A7
MNRSILVLLLFLMAFGVLLGFVSGSRSSDLAATQNEVEWSSSPLPVDYSASKGRFLQDLFASKLFPEPYSNQTVAEADVSAEAADPGHAAFPPIMSAARIDGEYKIQVRMPDGSIESIGANDTLPGDWIIKQVSLDKVVAEQDGETKVIDLVTPEPPA